MGFAGRVSEVTVWPVGTAPGFSVAPAPLAVAAGSRLAAAGFDRGFAAARFAAAGFFARTGFFALRVAVRFAAALR